VPVHGESALYPVHRIFCVGRNYVERAKEMGVEPEREAPWYFTKPATAIWSVPEIISHLSQYYHLGPGDLIYSGTPAGVGPVKPGDRLSGNVNGLAPVELTIAESDRIA
jgi:2-keto-4-pentenoate hydratase/2-oxohepta-3-ene-1,7-dioic acid hydratase in catechol pathway